MYRYYKIINKYYKLIHENKIENLLNFAIFLNL